MNNISMKLNLANLQCVVRAEKTQKGDLIDCLIIPIEGNSLFRGNKGVYLDLIAFPFESKIEGNKATHIIKQSLPKEVFKAMSDEQKKAMPIIGDATVWGDGQGSSAPVSDTETTLSPNDDLPF